MRLKRLQHVMMPAQPTTGFVMILPDFPFAFFKRGFNWPALSGDAHQFNEALEGFEPAVGAAALIGELAGGLLPGAVDFAEHVIVDRDEGGAPAPALPRR